MRRITSNGIGDSRRKEIRAEMQRKFPSRKHRVGPLSEYLGTGTPIVTKITGGQIARAIRNLTPGTAPGPDGFHAEHLRMTLKAQNLEIGKDVTNEIARYATAFGAGLLPVHTYYTGSRSWLVPVIKARLTDAAAVAPFRPVSNWIRSRESLDRRDGDCENGQSTGGVPATAAGIPTEWV